MEQLANQNAIIKNGKVLTFNQDGRTATVLTKKYLADDSYGASYKAQDFLETLLDFCEDLDNVEIIIDPTNGYYNDSVVSIWLESHRPATKEEIEEGKNVIIERLKSEREQKDRHLREMIREIESAGYSVLPD